MTQDELNQLAVYNAEVARGILHSAEWKWKMAGLQSQFDFSRRPRPRVRAECNCSLCMEPGLR